MAVIAIICAVIFGIKLIGTSNSEKTTFPSNTQTTLSADLPTTESTTTTTTTTTAPTTVTTKSSTTKAKKTDPADSYPFDVYKAAAAGLQAVYDHVVSPSSVKLEKASYDPKMDADNTLDMDVELYCTYVNQFGGLTGISCSVSLSKGLMDMGQDNMYNIGNSIYANCHIIDPDNVSGLHNIYNKLDVKKVVSVNQQCDW